MDIAIIGISLKCANIKTLEDYTKFLKNKNISTVQPTKERLVNSKIPQKDSYHPYGYLDRADFFDHEFFNISKGEANAIDPGHRMTLETVCEAIENSGYSLEDSSFQTAGLFTTTPAGIYNVLYKSENEGLDFIGGIPSIGGGRIANILNIRGPVMNIDTACSSSLVAVHEAVKYIKNGHINTAIVAGSHILFMFTEANTMENDPIMSSDGICRAFDDLAAGTTGGEGVAAIVLKRLDLAEKDNDTIIATIKGSAINNDGNRSTSVTAPSPVAQREVILSACKDANVPIESIEYIETHGTGTKLGDPIEYKGIKEAFSSQPEPYKVSIGTLKPNIGHLDNMAGLFGLLKAVTVLKEKKFYPLANFTTLNKFIEEDKNIIITNELTDWVTDQPKRRAGVSSFGLSGTNSHVILEEYLGKTKQMTIDNQDGYWFKIAAKTKEALNRYIDLVHDSVTQTSNIRNFAYTLNIGRADYKYRLAVSGNTVEELTEKLLNKKKEIDNLNNNRLKKIALLYLSDEIEANENFMTCSLFQNVFQKQIEELTQHEISSPILQTLAFQTTLFKYFSEKGFIINQLIGNGDIAKTSKSIIEGSKEISNDLKFENKPEIDIEKLKMVAKYCSENNTLLVIVGNNQPLIQSINSVLKEVEAISIDLIDLLKKNKWNYLWSKLYSCGLTFNWKEFYKDNVYSRIEAPTYPFEKVSCWNEMNPYIFNQPAEEKEESTKVKESIGNQDEEKVVMDVLKEVLQNFDIKLTDDFFELGGNSIVGIQFINRINEYFKINIVFDDLFECYEINDIVQLVKNQKLINGKTTESKEKEAAVKVYEYEASNSQQRMWIESQLDEGYYNIDLSYTIKGDINIPVFKSTIIELVKKHSSLRSSFILDDNGIIVQKIKDFDELNIDDFFSLYSKVDKSEIELKKEFKNFKFDLEKAPLFQAAIIQTNAEYQNLLFVFHHIIFDGWSVGIFVKDFVSIYHQILNNEYIPDYGKNDYVDYLIWLKESLNPETAKPLQSYWNIKLKNINSNLQLGNTNAISSKGARLNTVFSPILKEKLIEFSNKNRTTLFTLLLSSVRTFLYRLANENFVIGTPISGRVKKEFESMVGLFVNTLPIYTEINNNQSFTECLLLEKESVNKALEYQSYPYDLILNDLKVVNKKSFFDVLVVLQNHDSRAGLLNQNDLPFEIIQDNDQMSQFSRFNLAFTFFEIDDTIELELEYKTDVFNDEFISDFLTNYQDTLEKFVSIPDVEIGKHSIITESQYNNVVYKFNSTQVDFPQDKTLVELFESQVEKTPNAIAVVFDQEELTYAELNEQANQLGLYLREQYKVAPESFVGIKLDRSEKMIISILGILKSGGAYVPIDPSYPQERIEYIEKDSDCNVVIDEAFFSEFELVRSQYSPANLQKNNDSNHLAYVIYTSGTTGNPKGVMVEHKNVVNLIYSQTKEFDIQSDENILQFSNISFDASVEQIFLALLNGARLCIPDKNTIMDIEKLALFIDSRNITHCHAVPSILNKIETGNYPSLKRVIAGGDICSVELANKWSKYGQFYNEYGPTETTVTSIELLYNPEKTLSIGRPLSNTQVYIVDDNLQPVGLGISGKIYISGAGVTRGYLNKPELTAEKFIDNPFLSGTKMYDTGDLGRWLPDGTIEFLGRKDHQVKIRGFRIELGEIETGLLQFSPAIKQAFVEPKEVQGEKVLVAYYTTESEVEKTAIRSYLQSKLPEYMVPSYYVVLDQLPLTPNGKVDRKSLPGISGEDSIRKEYVAPRTQTEEKMAHIWQEVLGVTQVGITDHFFELGGHSLNATRLISLVHKTFNIRVSITDLFEHITLEELSLLVDNTLLYNINENEQNPVEETENFTL